MFLHKIVRALERIERNQTAILNRLGAVEGQSSEQPAEGSDKWLQDGIDSIMSYQAGKKREADQ